MNFVTSENFPGIFLPFTESEKQLKKIENILKKNENLKTNIIPILESINGLANLQEICSFKDRVNLIPYGKKTNTEKQKLDNQDYCPFRFEDGDGNIIYFTKFDFHPIRMCHTHTKVPHGGCL